MISHCPVGALPPWSPTGEPPFLFDRRRSVIRDIQQSLELELLGEPNVALQRYQTRPPEDRGSWVHCQDTSASGLGAKQEHNILDLGEGRKGKRSEGGGREQGALSDTGNATSSLSSCQRESPFFCQCALCPSPL
ncbi:UNVERIFIED_CONTAM: hypothetical protein FKN15_027674 [Acipenser sinensis]